MHQETIIINLTREGGNMEKKYYDEVLKEKLQDLIDGNGAQDIIRHICLDVIKCTEKYKLTEKEKENK
jgi:hypothetical protein